MSEPYCPSAKQCGGQNKYQDSSDVGLFGGEFNSSLSILKTTIGGVTREEKQLKKPPNSPNCYSQHCFASDPYSWVNLLLLNQYSFIYIMTYRLQLSCKIILKTKQGVLYTNQCALSHERNFDICNIALLNFCKLAFSRCVKGTQVYQRHCFSAIVVSVMYCHDAV